MADLSKLRDLCNVLGLDMLQRIHEEVAESVRDIDSWAKSDLRVETVHRLNSCVEGLSKIKLDRFTEIKKKAMSIVSYWNTLLVSFEKKQELISLVYYMQLESENEITASSALSLEFVNKVEEEYHKLHEQINSLVVKKKSKLLQILKTTHLTSSFVDNDIADPLAAFLDIRKQISEAKDQASQRAETVTKIELIQHANKEIDRYRNSENADVAQVKTLLKGLSKMLRNLEIELTNQAEPFIYDEGDGLKVLKTVAKQIDASSAEKAPTTEKIGDDELGAEPTGANMQVKPGEIPPLQPEVLPLHLPMQPDKIRPLFPIVPQFGFVPRAPRTIREPVEGVLLPAPPSPPSPPTPPDSDKSDESMYKSESDDADYDPNQDL